MEASGYESLVGLFRKLVVPFGDGGLFFSCWADFVGEVGSVLRGSEDALPRAAGVLLMPQHQATGAKKEIHATSCLVSWGGNKLLDSQCITMLTYYSNLLYSTLS
jgi:hypothetical protein